jgi:uncharacterized LabA/DUF88 family protein
MTNQKVNIAYIDAANLDQSLKVLGWKIDYKRFRVWLKDKYKVEKAYIFIGLIPKYKSLYTHLSEAGFTLVFKEVVYQGDANKPKGNCDTDLIMQAMEDYYEGDLQKAILVSSDGDYAPMVKKLYENDRFHTILSPAPSKRCSILLKRTGAKISYIDDQRGIFEKKEL